MFWKVFRVVGTMIALGIVAGSCIVALDQPSQKESSPTSSMQSRPPVNNGGAKFNF